MRDQKYCLFIDESGLSNPLATQDHPYILCGCSILEHMRNEVKTYADHIKYKYWGRTDVVFHSVDIAKGNYDFNIFKEQHDTKEEFLKDLFSFLKTCPVRLTTVLVDKQKALQYQWNKNKVVKETSRQLLRNFILMIYAQGNVKGSVIIESASEKDPYYLKALNEYYARGIEDTLVSGSDVKQLITSISFVSKNNHDIETQVADLLAYGAKCYYFSKYQKKIYKVDSYERTIMEILKSKLFTVNPKTSLKKKTTLKKINPFVVLP